jgi:hypothetical protein
MDGTRVASARQVFLRARPAPLDEQVRLENSFFKSICLPNGTHKTTARDRLADVDEVIGDHFRDSPSVRLLDVGISSGVTTLELIDRLEARGTRAGGVGIDICVRGFVWSFLGIDLLHDAEGHVLQVATPFFARGRPHRSQKSLRSRLLRLGMDVFEASPVPRWVARSRRSRPVSLVSPRLLGRGDFEVVEHDVARPMPAWEGTFDLVRVANVLNRDYFEPSHVVTMVKNLTSWLKVGGVLVICSTSAADGRNHGSFYHRRSAGPGLEPGHGFGQGYELEPVLHEAGCVRPRG